MASGVKVGGTWQTISKAWIRVAGVWQQATVHGRVAGVWQTFVSSALVQLLSQSVATVNFGGDCYSGVKLDANGNIYKHTNTGGWTSFGAWLLDGVNSDYWAVATYVGDTLYSSSGLNTTQSLSTDRYWRVRDTTSFGGARTGTLTLKIYDASSGGNLLAEQTYALSALEDSI